MTRKVAIVARAMSSRYLAPINDETWEIWTLSPFPNEDGRFTDLPRWTRWYELHSMKYVEQHVPGVAEWLTAQKVERPNDVWLQDDVPVNELVTEFGFDYFTSSIAYIFAHAIYEGVDEIGVYGCDFAHRTEYTHQRPCAEFWLGVAVGRGIKVTIPPECDIVRTRWRYGYQDGGPLQRKRAARKEELVQRIVKTEEEIQTNMRQTGTVVGVRQEMQDLTLNVNGEMPKAFHEYAKSRDAEFVKFIREAHEQAEQLKARLYLLKGCEEELEYEEQWG